MVVIPKFTGMVNNGELKMNDKKSFLDFVSTLDGKVEVVVKKWHDKRSEKQNRYYWGVVIQALVDYTGYTLDEMHETMKHKFLSEEDIERGLTKIKSTKDTNTREFVEYIRQIITWASTELGVYIPEPNESDWSDRF